MKEREKQSTVCLNYMHGGKEKCEQSIYLYVLQEICFADLKYGLGFNMEQQVLLGCKDRGRLRY